MIDDAMETCPGCGADVPVQPSGATHAYLGASPGCWAVFGEVLAREYSDALYMAVHPLTVDAYALQHPGTPSPQTIQSAALHLISLGSVLTRDLSLPRAAAIRKRAKAQLEDRFSWLEPPDDMGSTTVLDVHAAEDAIDHRERVRRWAEDVWAAWSPHHGTVERWIEALAARSA